MSQPSWSGSSSSSSGFSEAASAASLAFDRMAPFASPSASPLLELLPFGEALALFGAVLFRELFSASPDWVAFALAASATFGFFAAVAFRFFVAFAFAAAAVFNLTASLEFTSADLNLPELPTSTTAPCWSLSLIHQEAGLQPAQS